VKKVNSNNKVLEAESNALRHISFHCKYKHQGQKTMFIHITHEEIELYPWTIMGVSSIDELFF